MTTQTCICSHGLLVYMGGNGVGVGEGCECRPPLTIEINRLRHKKKNMFPHIHIHAIPQNTWTCCTYLYNNSYLHIHEYRYTIFITGIIYLFFFWDWLNTFERYLLSFWALTALTPTIFNITIHIHLYTKLSVHKRAKSSSAAILINKLWTCKFSM